MKPTLLKVGPSRPSRHSVRGSGVLTAFLLLGLRVFDKESNGKISEAGKQLAPQFRFSFEIYSPLFPLSFNVPPELRHVLTSLGEKLSEDEVDRLLVVSDCSSARASTACSKLFDGGRAHKSLDDRPKGLWRGQLRGLHCGHYEGIMECFLRTLFHLKKILHRSCTPIIVR